MSLESTLTIVGPHRSGLNPVGGRAIRTALMFPQHDERRRDARFNLSVPCVVTWENQRLDGRTVNLSQGGVCIDRTLTIPPEGARIQLTIRWKGVHLLSGRVPHNLPADEARGAFARFGLEFDGLDFRFRRLLAAQA